MSLLLQEVEYTSPGSERAGLSMLASAIAKLYARREVVRAGADMGEKGRAVAPTDGASTPRTGSGYPRGGRLRGVRQLSSPSASRALRRKLVGDFAGGHKGRQVGQVARDAVDLAEPAVRLALHPRGRRGVDGGGKHLVGVEGIQDLIRKMPPKRTVEKDAHRL